MMFVLIHTNSFTSSWHIISQCNKLVSSCSLNQQQDLEDEAHALLQQLLPLSGAVGRDASTSNGLIEVNFASSLQAAPSPEEAGDTEKEK